MSFGIGTSLKKAKREIHKGFARINDAMPGGGSASGGLAAMHYKLHTTEQNNVHKYWRKSGFKHFFEDTGLGRVIKAVVYYYVGAALFSGAGAAGEAGTAAADASAVTGATSGGAATTGAATAGTGAASGAAVGNSTFGMAAGETVTGAQAFNLTGAGTAGGIGAGGAVGGTTAALGTGAATIATTPQATDVTPAPAKAPIETPTNPGFGQQAKDFVSNAGDRVGKAWGALPDYGKTAVALGGMQIAGQALASANTPSAGEDEADRLRATQAANQWGGLNATGGAKPFIAPYQPQNRVRVLTAEEYLRGSGAAQGFDPTNPSGGLLTQSRTIGDRSNITPGG